MSTTPQQPHPPAHHRLTSVEQERLSALVDGEPSGPGRTSADDLSGVLSVWRQDAEARKTWHTYQLIGDVLRSDDLARSAQRDLAFLERLSARLEAEPVHRLPDSMPALMPTPMPTPMTAPAAPAASVWRRHSKAGTALAASFAVAAVALLLAREAGLSASPDGAGVVATAGQRAGEHSPVSAQGGARAVNTAGVLRDPRLDEFLRLHQMARGGLAAGVPGGTLQRADLQMPGGTGP